MYLCLLHASVHSYHRAPGLLLYKDIDLCVDSNVDWNVVYSYAIRDDSIVRITVSLLVSNFLLGTTIPIDKIEFYSRKFSNVKSIFELVIDRENNILRQELSKINLFIIEGLSDDNLFLINFFKIIFPDTNWMRIHYSHIGYGLMGKYIKHIYNLLS